MRTLTRRSGPNPFGERVEILPLDFNDLEGLTESLRGATVLYNTYWIRFPRGSASFAGAVARTRILLRAAVAAGVDRVVHISVTNPSLDSPLPYFRGKAEAEEAVAGSGLPFAIVRPSLIFGAEDILINNLAWLVRRFSFFLLPGQGDYRVQPVSADDVARLAVESAEGKTPQIVDAVGPEVLTFAELLEEIARAIGRRIRLVSSPPAVALLACRFVGLALRDVLLTRDELSALMANKLVSANAPTCADRFSLWLKENATTVGICYASELRRHYNLPSR